MYSASLGRHSTSVAQRSSSGVAVRLLSSTPGKVRIGRAGTFAGIDIPVPTNQKVVQDDANVKRYASRLDKFKAGQSPMTFHPERTRTFQPGLSWLGDDEFESTGLAFRLSRHLMRPETINEPTSGSRPRRNGENTRTRVKPSENTKAATTSKHKRDSTQNRRPERVDRPKAKAVKLGVSKEPITPRPTSRPPAPQTPSHVDFESTDLTSLFGVSTLPIVPPSTTTRITPTDAASRYVQLALEYRGGDYSRLVPNTLVSSEGDPLIYAANTMARMRDLGPNRRSNALEIVRGMVGNSQVSQPTP